jgi:HPt (histidine-containing phosphotransfer) domain-containing protein
VDSREPIDPGILAELRDLQKSASPAFLEEIIDLFLQRLDESLPLLRKALADRDLETLVRVSHTLKGTCGSVGALRMTEMCGRLNQSVRRGEWEAGGRAITEIEDEARLVRAALESEKSR